MKLIKFLLVALVVVCFVSFSGCNPIEDLPDVDTPVNNGGSGTGGSGTGGGGGGPTTSIDKSKLIGAWKWSDDYSTVYLALFPNGTCEIVNVSSEGLERKQCEWRYERGVLWMTGDYGLMDPFPVIRVTDNKLVLDNEEGARLVFTHISYSDIPTDGSDKPDDNPNTENPDIPDEKPGGEQSVVTASAEPRAFRATLKGQYFGQDQATRLGMIYSYDPSFPAYQTVAKSADVTSGFFSVEAVNLVDQAKVYYQAYAEIDGQTYFGEVKSFTTLEGTYSIDGETYKFIKVTGLPGGSFSMMQTELPPGATMVIDGVEIGSLHPDSNGKTTKGYTRDFFNKFCQAAVYPRYPTVAEWQFAASGGNLSNGYSYSGSNDINDVAFYAGNSNGHVRTPAQLTPNELGFYDMSGNYAELCANYDSDILRDIKEKYIKGFAESVTQTSALPFNTTWNAGGGAYGGSWKSNAGQCTISSHEIYTSPCDNNWFNGTIYTMRICYSRPD